VSKWVGSCCVGFYTQRALIEVVERNFWNFVRDAVYSGRWQQLQRQKPPHVFVENLVHLAKPWSRPFLHLMGFFSAHGIAQKGSWSRVGHHYHISRQNRRKFCLDWQHTHWKSRISFWQLLDRRRLGNLERQFSVQRGVWVGIWRKNRRNRESRGALEFFFRGSMGFSIEC